MIEIYDDTDESTLPFDLKWSGRLILLVISTCLIVATLAALGSKPFFEISTTYGVSIYAISGFVSIGLYVLMHEIQKYPSFFAALSFLILGLSTHITGFDTTSGITMSLFSAGYIVLYLFMIQVYNVDKPDK